MGSERASTIRQRESGRVCWQCKRSIPPPASGKERLCWQCIMNQPRHRVLMHFMHRKGWHVTFFESDCRTVLRAKFTFADPAKLREIATHGDAMVDRHAIYALDEAIEMGRGSVWLHLKPDQYAKLK